VTEQNLFIIVTAVFPYLIFGCGMSVTELKLSRICLYVFLSRNYSFIHHSM